MPDFTPPPSDPWAPLVALFGACDGVNHGPACNYMFMGAVSGPWGPVHLYKNAKTRRYLALDGQGRAYVYQRGELWIELRPVELSEVLAEI